MTEFGKSPEGCVATPLAMPSVAFCERPNYASRKINKGGLE